MSKYLRPLLESGAGTVRWIEPNGYATRAYAGGNAGWAAEAQTCAATLAQANSVLKSQVLGVDLAPALFAGAAAPAGEPLDYVEQTLDAQAGRERALQVVKAVEHSLADRVDLMLQLPSPAALLRRGGAAGGLSLDDLDDSAAALANFVRSFSECRVVGLMLNTDADEDGGADEMDVLGPILGAARHYRWLAALRIDGGLAVETAAGSGVDLLLLPKAAPSDFASGWALGDCRLGGGLSGSFWQGENFPAVTEGALHYGDAPAEVAPEQILARLRDLG